MTDPTLYSGATFSDCKTFRYKLWRRWDLNKPMILFIGLNPSRANETFNDPTITRAINFAKDWGYGGLFFGNLYAFRTPYPKELIEKLDIAIGPDNDFHLQEMARQSDKVVYAWGSWDFIFGRTFKVKRLFADPWCFGINKDGNPKHPLYLKKTAELINFKSAIANY
jgi:hypothetical protein